MPFWGDFAPSGVRSEGPMRNSQGTDNSGPAEFSPRDRAPRQPILNAPPIVTGAALVLIFAFLALRLLPQNASTLIEWSGAVSPARFARDVINPLRAPQALLTLVTHMLLHSNFAHIALNSVWLVAFGAPVARKLGDTRSGRIAFVAFLLASGAAGALFFIALHLNSTTLLIGASGGVSGILGGLVRFAFLRPGDPADRDDLAPLASRQVIVWSIAVVGLNLFAGVFTGALGLGDVNIAWEAHVGGYLFGAATFPAFLRFAERKARPS